MTAESIETPQNGFSRRTLVKGAAWSLPVIAVAASTPLAAASVAPDWDATVTSFCEGDYDLSILEGLGLGILLPLVETALGVLGLQAGATRGFTVTATTGDIPAGTSYLLTDPNALLTLSGLEAVIGAGVAGVVSTTDGFVITTTNVTPQGSSFTVDVYNAVVNVGALSGFTLTQVESDANDGDNSATTATLLAAAIDLSALGVLGASGTLAVQTCDL